MSSLGIEMLKDGTLQINSARLETALKNLPELAAATRLAPDDARFAYVYAVALDSAGRRDAARRELERALVRHPDDADLKTALSAYADR